MNKIMIFFGLIALSNTCHGLGPEWDSTKAWTVGIVGGMVKPILCDMNIRRYGKVPMHEAYVHNNSIYLAQLFAQNAVLYGIIHEPQV